jgi:hypothetical protein
LQALASLSDRYFDIGEKFIQYKYKVVSQAPFQIKHYPIFGMKYGASGGGDPDFVSESAQASCSSWSIDCRKGSSEIRGLGELGYLSLGYNTSCSW